MIIGYLWILEKAMQKRKKFNLLLYHRADQQSCVRVWKEITKKEETSQESERLGEQSRDESEEATSVESAEHAIRNTTDTEEETTEQPERHVAQSKEAKIIASRYEKAVSWLSTSGSTVPLRTVSETMNLSMKLLHHRVETRQIRATKNKAIVYKSSVIQWAIAEIIPKERTKIVHLNAVRKAEETRGNDEPQTAAHETIEA